MNRPIYLCLAKMSGREQEFISRAFETNWVVPLGPNVDGFEADLRDYLGGRNEVVALSSGTAALHLALLLLGVSAGDEVVCQSFTFCASANPIVYLGARAVFVDSESASWNMSAELLEKAILDRVATVGRAPKAIVVVHLYGMPAAMDKIAAVAKKYDIPIVEDAAEALGSSFEGRACGTFGRFGILSFNGNKMITTSGGGALICNDLEDKRRAMFYASQAREDRPYYHHEKIGYNYRMSNICAGIGRGQMTILADHLAHHGHVHEFYTRAFSGLEGISLHANPSPSYHSNYWLSTILIDEAVAGFGRDELYKALVSSGIESRPLWKPLHLQPVFGDCPSYLDSTSERLFDRGLCLPSGPWVGENELNRIVTEILKLKNNDHKSTRAADDPSVAAEQLLFAAGDPLPPEPARKF